MDYDKVWFAYDIQNFQFDKLISLTSLLEHHRMSRYVKFGYNLWAFYVFCLYRLSPAAFGFGYGSGQFWIG